MKKTRRQLIAEVNRLHDELGKVKEQIHFLQRSVHERNMRADKAERSEKAAQVSLEAIRKLYVDG